MYGDCWLQRVACGTTFAQWPLAKEGGMQSYSVAKLHVNYVSSYCTPYLTDLKLSYWYQFFVANNCSRIIYLSYRKSSFFYVTIMLLDFMLWTSLCRYKSWSMLSVFIPNFSYAWKFNSYHFLLMTGLLLLPVI